VFGVPDPKFRKGIGLMLTETWITLLGLMLAVFGGFVVVVAVIVVVFGGCVLALGYENLVTPPPSPPAAGR